MLAGVSGFNFASDSPGIKHWHTDFPFFISSKNDAKPYSPDVPKVAIGRTSLAVNGKPMKLFQRRTARDESLTFGSNTDGAPVRANMYVVLVGEN